MEMETPIAVKFVERCEIPEEQSVHNALVFSQRHHIERYYKVIIEPIITNNNFQSVELIQKLMSTTSLPTLDVLSSEKHRKLTNHFSTAIFRDRNKILFEALKSEAVSDEIKSFGYIETFDSEKNLQDFLVWIKLKSE